MWTSFLLAVSLNSAWAFWDKATTTLGIIRTDNIPRQSFFRWQRTEPEGMRFWAPYFDWSDQAMRKKLFVISGISIDFLPITTGALMNRRTVISSANPLDPYMNRQRDLRIWALGRGGGHNMPYRYRVWRVRRILPRSSNPEHAHGPRGRHVSRHDVTVIHSMDQIYIYFKHPWQTHYAYRTKLCSKRQILGEDLFFAGSGYEYLVHIMENYKIFYAMTKREYIVDCSRYLPKWWGKFICIKNTINVSGIPNGGSLFINKGIAFGVDDILVGVGCFEIRYNEERIMVFTDLRYYVDLIYQLANITAGQYYEFAYPQWSVVVTWIYDGAGNRPYIPSWQIFDDLFPLGR